MTPGGTRVAPLYSRFCICNEPRSRQGRYKPADCSIANCPADCARGHRFQIADCSALSRLSLQIVRLQIADCQITDCSPSVSTRRLQIADCRLRAPGMDWEEIADCRLCRPREDENAGGGDRLQIADYDAPGSGFFFTICNLLSRLRLQIVKK